MGVEGCAPGLRPRLFGSQQPSQLGPLGGEAAEVLVEDLRYGAPSGPPRQDRLLAVGCPPILESAQLEDAESGEVGVELRLGARRCQVVLFGRPEGWRSFGGRISRGCGAYGAVLIARLISARSR